MLIQLVDDQPFGNPVTEENFRQLHPNVSFPAILTPASVEGSGFGMYEFSQVPTPQRYEKVVEGIPAQDANGMWRQQWSCVAMTSEEMAQADEQQAELMRNQRNRRLTECDWTQLSDSPITGDAQIAWAAYRQSLRDITSQEGFPWEISWPEPPAATA